MGLVHNRYHWALLIGPKNETPAGIGVRFDAKEKIEGPGRSAWVFEEREISLFATEMLLVRMVIAKIEKRDLVESILRNVPIRQRTEGWNCVGWVKEALELLTDNNSPALGTNVTEWVKVRDAVMSYCERKKKEHRFDGKGNFDTRKVPTYDLILDKEIIE